ncbi:hypothetical protein PWEIH_03561 [Listeria weihenstephanensis FSL R9-0317]|uniref:VanZ family protein n=1 Tax=Listeria weihenstephanensis TaxID=1006155 RepID=UPI0003E86FDB|nr:VanZ family protein [Listeria weihenstephanensis]EUJ40602.1 hypothetical protein PWEIH_03561 [Listeria weihenstephanensis FSL R9-0317]
MIVIKSEILLVIAPLIYIPFLIHWIKQKTPIEKIVFKSFMFIYIIGVISFTLFPIDLATGDRDAIFSDLSWFNLIPFGTISEIYSYREYDTAASVFQVVANIIMFVPLGCLYPLCSKYQVSWKRMLITAFICTLSIELAQLVQNLLYQTVPHRIDVDDLILNTTGAMIGFGLFMICRPVFKKLNVYEF